MRIDFDFDFGFFILDDCLVFWRDKNVLIKVPEYRRETGEPGPDIQTETTVQHGAPQILRQRFLRQKDLCIGYSEKVSC